MAGSARPTLSVLMSVYNGERFLKPAIESILGQTLKDFEFIIINDGSKDNSLKIIKSYNDPRIRLIDRPNKGFIYSLNEGAGLAKGKYIARMDQDDISLPTRFEEQMKILESNQKAGAVSTFFELINFKDSKPTGVTMVFPVENIDIKRALYIHNPMAHGSTIFRKEAWEMAGKYRSEYHPPEDYDLWRRIAADWELAIVPKVLFQYRINNPESMSQANSSTTEAHVQKIQLELREGPFFYKSLRKTISDYRAIDSNSYGDFHERARGEYKNLQFSLARTFLFNVAPAKAIVPTVFIILFWPGISYELIRLYPKRIYVNIMRRLKRI